VCCFIVKNDDDEIVSTGVEKLNVSNSNISPKKKKNTQNENKKYDVDREVIVVKLKRYNIE